MTTSSSNSYGQDTHPGNMPIRVLQHNITYYFETADPCFLEQARRYVRNGQVSAGIEYVIAEEPVDTPKANCDSRTIRIQETFLASLWAMSYFFLTVQESISAKYRKGERPRSADFDDPDIVAAHRLLAWARSLFFKYSPWPADLPNPEHVSEKDVDYTGKVNNIFLQAAIFCLAHELGHLVSGHCEAFAELRNSQDHETALAEMKSLENEADQYARNFLTSVCEKDSEECVRLFGVLVAYLGMLFSYEDVRSLRGTTHPDLDTRIFNTLMASQIGDPGYREVLIMVTTLGLKYFLGLTGNNLETTVFEDANEMLDFYMRKFDRLKEL